MAFINGDDEHTWGPDPSLTPLGHEQTKAVGEAWKREAAAGAPIDKIRFFTSPLQRTCQTMINSWGDMLGPPETWEVSSRRRAQRGVAQRVMAQGSEAPYGRPHNSTLRCPHHVTSSQESTLSRACDAERLSGRIAKGVKDGG